ncbi:cytochrome P450 [Streptomyces xiamenensis]|uniref:cytochrome P450 n=1 Tax=Streptomyces xiamenensis TaxID=408015 RepID=UPI0036E2FEE7
MSRAPVRIPPECGISLSSPLALADPYPLYEEMRALAPVVRLGPGGQVAVTGHDEVAAALDDPVRFAAQRSRGTPAHDVVARIAREGRNDLSVRAHTRAGHLVSAWARTGTPDAVDLARRTVAAIVMDILGTPASVQGSRPGEIEAFAAHLANPAYGGQRNPAASAAAALYQHEREGDEGVWTDLAHHLGRSRVQREDIRAELIRYATADIDAAIASIATTIHLLATHAEQWHLVRTRRASAEQAWREAVRLDPPLRALRRRLTCGTVLGGYGLPAGCDVWLLLGAAGRDPGHWTHTGDQFRVQRPIPVRTLLIDTAAPGDLTHLAAASVLGALAVRCATVAPAAPAVRHPHPVWRSLACAPLTVSVGAGFSG